MIEIMEMVEAPHVKLKQAGNEIQVAQVTVISNEVMEFPILESSEMMETPMIMMGEVQHAFWKPDGHDLVLIQQHELSTDLMG